MTRLMTLLATAGMGGVLWVSAAAAGELSTRQLRGLFPGKFHAVVRGATVQFTARRNGRLIGHYNSATDQGRWSVSKGRLCIVLDTWMDGKMACSTVTEKDGWYRAADVRFGRI
jgi:hypothetical protein